LEKSGQGTEAKDDAFNECKTTCARIFEARFAHLETTVAAEIEALKKDEFCESRVSMGLVKLRDVIEQQAVLLRTSVPRDKIKHFLDDFKASLERASTLLKSVKNDLQSSGVGSGT
jgi:hypothetical protein